MRVSRRRTGVVAVAVAALVMLLGTPASAAQGSPYQGSPSSYNTCVYGQYEGSQSGSLSNGSLKIYLCVYADEAHHLSTVTVEYQKKAGSRIDISLGWRWTDNKGVAFTDPRDGPFYSQASGTTWTEQWYWKEPGENEPSATKHCVQGQLYSSTNNSFDGPYVTKVYCL